MAKTFWVDFSGYLKIKAENEKEVERKFWDFINTNCDTSYTDLSDDVWDIECIEECVEEVY